jgi:glycolate oxidase FAD binding subunit
VTTFAPRTADEVTDAVRRAVAAGEALEVIAAGTKRGLGRPVQAPHRLDVSGLTGVVSYEPAELVLTARPGTPMAEIEALLAAHSQCLAFEPPNLAALFGERPGGTLGGLVSAGLSGPRRVKAGAARDHVLGIAAVSGRGEAFVAGGKVVKNVTGYDLPKLITGAYGTLGVLTEITLKVLPAPEDARTLILHALSVREAVRAMTGALQLPMEISAACHLPGERDAESTTAFRLEGFTPSVTARLATLSERFGLGGSRTVLEREASLEFWREVRDVTRFAAAPNEREVWRLSIPPAAGADVVERVQRAIPEVRTFLDWGGGLIWAQLPATSNEAHAHASSIRGALGATGGHATLVRASTSVRASTDVFHPQAAALAALSKRVKAQFDPSRVLNPGRLYADS